MNYYVIPGLKRQFMEWKRNVRQDIILDSVCEHYGLSREDIFKKNRQIKLCNSRYVAYSLLYKYTSMSKSDIGKLFYMHHTSIIHGIKVMKKMFDSHDLIIDDYLQIEEAMQRCDNIELIKQ